MTDEICFSGWVSWKNRNGLASGRGGLYLFARFEREVPSGPANPLEKSVVYIGQSSKQTFRSRWNPFGRGLRNPATAKGRAARYIKSFGVPPLFPHVAVLPIGEIVKSFSLGVPCPWLDLYGNAANAKVNIGSQHDFLEKIEDLLVKYMERRLILLYALEHGARPALNKE